jgi:glycosyltransferase involved in cell wall biosynthesis
VSSGARLKVLSIAHPAVSRAAGRLRYHPLAASRNIDVHLLVPERWHQFGRTIAADPPDDPGVTVHVLPISLSHAGPMTWYLHFYPGLRGLINRIRPDVIHLWEEPWSAVALQATLLKGRAALVMEVDQNILKRLPPPFEAIRRFVLRRTAHVLSRSPDSTAVVRARGYDGPVSAIGYGVDQATFRPRCALRPKGTRENGLRIGYVGRVVEEKGLDDALDAMARARSHVTLAIMGEGPYEVRLRERARQLGLADRVSFEGWGPPAEVARFMSRLDVLVLLTRTTKSVREQFGRVIVEAQSCGVPVIGSSCGSIPSVIAEGGWVVPERSPEAIASILDTIATDSATWNLRSLSAQRNVSTRFTYEAIADVLRTTWMEAATNAPAMIDIPEGLSATTMGNTKLPQR